MPEITLLLVLLAGVAAGFFDSALGAGGLISVPSLIFLGLPPQVAIATDRFGTLGQMTTAFFKFWKAKKILWKYVPILAAISLVGSLIGANILLAVDPNILQQIVGVFLLVLLPFIFLKQNIGVKRSKVPKSKAALGLLIYFLIMIFGGFFGQGTGPMIFYALTYFLGFTMIEVLATGIIPWFVLSISSLVIFALYGIIDYEVGIVLLIGMAVGGYIGAHVVLKKGDLWVKRLFILFVIISGLKLLFF
ncbi:MAG: sulfite exporter TauE/SafE family protein [Candidatus Diapherotrites archaeon]|nr:sulfite exporter TauE/SafE family protein [Candidatus Diapherotrites archaeon]